METLRVLLVEDDEDDYIITRDLLSEVGQTDYQLEWVNNGEEGLSKLRKQGESYDVCLLDYRLGSQTGLDIMRTLMAEGFNVPMILLTEHSDRQIDLSAMQEGASDYLVKSEINSINLDRVIRYVCAVKKHERERLALALAVEQRKQAEAANKSKDDFLGMVSHELRGPINSILLWTELLKSPEVDQETMKTAVETIERSVLQQGKILDDLVELTRSLNGMIKLYKHAVNLTEIVKNAVTNQQLVASKKNIALGFSAEHDELFVEADPDRLQQIFSNLLTNSIKFTPEQGEIQVNIHRKTFENKPYAEVGIKDTGIGIPSDLLPYVFDRYLQAPTHSYSSNTGLGLGLTIARQLVELHQGKIRAESAGQHQGATFFVSLPLVEHKG